MKSSTSVVNSYTRQIKVEVPWEDLESKYQAFLKKFSTKINLPGYRKGKIPQRIIQQQFAPMAESEFAEQAVQEFYMAALEEGNHDPINQASITHLHFHEGSNLDFEATFEVEPEVKLPNYRKGMKFQEIIFDRDAEDVRLALADLQQQRAQLRTVEEGASEGHFILGDLQEVDPEGTPLIGRKSEDQYLQLTSDGPMAGDNLQRLIGAKTGEQRRITLPGENGNTAHFEVTVKQVSEQLLPDLDDEFAKQVNPETESLKNLETNLGEKIQESFNRESAKRLTRDVADHFVRHSKLEVPTSMIDTYIDNLIDDLRRQGYPEESIEREQVVIEHQATVVWNIKWYLMRRQLIEEEEIEIEDEALDVRITEMVAADSAQAQQIKNFYKRPENRRSLREDLVSEALMERLKKFAKIKEIHKPSIELRKVSQQQ